MSMTRRERLMASVRGETVDRPPYCFYEINGLTENRESSDPFNIYSHPSWAPFLDLARDKSDRIVQVGVPMLDVASNPVEPLTETESWIDDKGSQFVRTSIKTDTGPLTQLTRRDPDVNTVWTLEHLLKDEDDLETWLSLPHADFSGTPDTAYIHRFDEQLGDTGIVMLDTGDPLCTIAAMFEMGEYTILGLTNEELMHRALSFVSERLLPRIEAIASALPGYLWRIVGPEYASPPYLPPHLFEAYVTHYVRPMVDIIHKHGGFARVHSHGRLKDILPHIAATGCMGLDPIEPPHQGDVELAYVREQYGEQMTLFGNLEITDIENLPQKDFRKKVETALDEGMRGKGRGFVLMPSACPYGRILPENTLRNYEVMVDCVERL